MTIAYYADDFTGAVDSLLQFRRAGLTGLLSTGLDGVPTGLAASGDSEEYEPSLPDVVGIAGVSRSLPTDELAAEMGPVFDRLAATGAAVVQYKVCSTADSSAERGSIGRVCDLASERFGPRPIPAVFAQPSFGRFTFFGHHFAAEAGQVHRLDRQPTMRDHPVTPAAESDLALHLATQTTLPTSVVTWQELEAIDETGDVAAIVERFSRGSSEIVVCDAFKDRHLETIGRAILTRADDGSPHFVVGSGGLSLGLGLAIGGNAPRLPTSVAIAEGPCLVLSGSRSAQTWAQINAAVAAGWINVDLRHPGAVAEAIELHAAGHNTIVQTTDPRGASMLESDIVTGLADVGRACVQQRAHTRLVICGGDSSGAVLRALGVTSLTLRATPWGNVALCEGSRHDGAVEVVLKGGQMGQTELFEDIRLGRSQ